MTYLFGGHVRSGECPLEYRQRDQPDELESCHVDTWHVIKYLWIPSG